MAQVVTVADRWKVRVTPEPIGQGGFGKVYIGEDLNDTPPSEVAAKKVAVPTSAEKEALQSELAMQRKVHSHKNVATVIGDTQEGSIGWMILELCNGGELFDRLIESKTLSEKAAYPYVKGLCEAIAHCHSEGIAHRDVKLENVMLLADDPFAVRLIDFGLALQLQTADGGIAPGQVCREFVGTQAYRAPEVSLSGYDPAKFDVWSTGIVLFSLCAGFFPLQEAHTTDWRFKKLVENTEKGLGACDALFQLYRRPCPFSPALKELLDGMLQVSPNKRLSIAEVLASEWIQTNPWPTDGEDDDDRPVYRSMGEEDEAGAMIEWADEMVPISRQRAKRGADDGMGMVA